MLQQGSLLKVYDNTGVVEIKCIKVRGKDKLGVSILGSVKKLRTGFTGGYKRGDLVKGVRLNKKIRRRKGGNILKLETNGVLLVSDKGDLKGTRINGITPMEVRSLGLGKLLIIGNNVI